MKLLVIKRYVLEPHELPALKTHWELSSLSALCSRSAREQPACVWWHRNSVWREQRKRRARLQCPVQTMEPARLQREEAQQDIRTGAARSLKINQNKTRCGPYTQTNVHLFPGDDHHKRLLVCVWRNNRIPVQHRPSQAGPEHQGVDPPQTQQRSLNSARREVTVVCFRFCTIMMMAIKCIDGLSIHLTGTDMN